MESIELKERINETAIITLFSKRLLNKLIQHDINTIDQIQNLSIEQFAGFESVGEKTVIEFTGLKKLINEKPSDVAQKDFFQRRLDLGISEEILEIPLSYLRDSISNKLCHIFKKQGYIKIDDIINIEIDYFKNIESVGEKTIDEFSELFTHLPDWDLTKYYQLNDNKKNDTYISRIHILTKYSKMNFEIIK